VAYGLVHDQVTVRVSLEYFTIGHPQLITTSSPTLLALFWGAAATWWVGLPRRLGRSHHQLRGRVLGWACRRSLGGPRAEEAGRL